MNLFQCDLYWVFIRSTNNYVLGKLMKMKPTQVKESGTQFIVKLSQAYSSIRVFSYILLLYKALLKHAVTWLKLNGSLGLVF